MRRLLATVVAGAMATAGLVGLAGSVAGATPVTVNFDCQINAPVVGTQQLNQSFELDASAPGSVSPGSTFTLSAVTSPATLPTTVTSGSITVTVNTIRNFVVTFPLPANASYVSSSLTGGSGLGAGTPSLAHSGSNLILSVAGPIAGGATFQFPTVNVVLKATGSIGSQIVSTIGGTSYADPGLTFTVNADIPVIGNSDMPAACFPSPSPTLSSTSIVADTTSPTATIVTPADGGNYIWGSVVPADYTCADDQYGSGLASCVGPVADGAAIDTSTLGSKTFTVTAKDVAGNTSTTTSTYGVISPTGDLTPPSITIAQPTAGALYSVGQSVAASFSCSDAGGLASCTGTVANGAAIDTASAGPKIFTVNALDNAGNPETRSISYYVMSRTTTTLGPTTVGTLSATNSVNVDGARATVQVQAPAANGGKLTVGDTIRVDWSVFKGTMGFPDNYNGGPDPVYWTLPAPTNTSVTGSVTADENDLLGKTHGDAHSGSGSTGPTAVTPSAGQVAVTWDDQSSPGVFTAGDGIIMHVGFNVTVTAPGPITIQGFPGLTGTDPSIPSGPFSTTAITVAQVSIAYNAVDTAPPSVSLTSPLDGALFTPHQAVTAAYTCTDNVGVSSCVGSVSNGGAVDTSIAGPHQFTVTATDAAGNTATQVNTYYVLDPTVELTGCEGTEAGTCAFLVSLSSPSWKPITVQVDTASGTAVEGEDFTGVHRTVSFSPGATAVVVPVALTDDDVVESDETLTLGVSNASNATIADSTVTGTIHDGTVTYTLAFTDAGWAQYQSVASALNVDPTQFPALSLQFINYISSGVHGPPNPISPPPNTGDHTLVVPVTQAFNSNVVGAWSTHWGLTGSDVLKTSELFLEFLWLLGAH